LTLKGNYKLDVGLITNGGLNAHYYTTVDFLGLHLSTVDQTIDYDKNLDPLLTGYPADYYSVVWEGHVLAKGPTERYWFYVDSQDYFSIQVLIDDTFVINTLESHHCFGDIVLKEGNLHHIQIKYIEKKGRSRVRVLWESDSVEKEVIPMQQLYNTLFSSTTPFSLTVIPWDTHQMFVGISNGY